MPMTTDLLQQARRLPNGAHFHRCALQVNPHGYLAKFRGAPGGGDPAQHARDMVDKAVELGITVLAITDHNCVDDVRFFRAAAEGKSVHVFPGFEIASSEGVHVLCVYAADTDTEQLKLYLGGFGITKPGSSSEISSERFVDVVARVHEQGGVAIAAHVTDDNGLFTSLSGKPRIAAWRAERLSAIQIPGTLEDLAPEHRQILRNQTPEYRREVFADADQAVAVVNAKDVTVAADLAHPRATCWIKMSEVTIEGLRQAFLDPGSRVLLNPKHGSLESSDHAELVCMTWEGGFFDGEAIHFNKNLNVLVGGRGTGKSTIVESLRAVLGLTPVGDDARDAYEGLVRQVLRAGTRLSLVVRTEVPSPREYRIERTLPNPPIVRDADGNVSNLTPAQLLPRVQVFGQHEISELTKSREKLTRLLDRFVERDDAAARRLVDMQRELEKNRRAVLDTDVELRQIEERLSALPGLEETLRRFRDAGVEDKLRERTLLLREEKVLAAVPERLAPLQQLCSDLSRDLHLDRAFLSERALDDLPDKQNLRCLDAVFQELEAKLQGLAAGFAEALAKADGDVAEIRRRWGVRKQAIEEQYTRLLRDLQKSKVDGEEFLRLRRQIEDLRPLTERRAMVQRFAAEHAERRRNLLVDWENLKAEEHRRLRDAAKRVGRKLKDRVQVEVQAAGDRGPLLDLVKEVGGRLSDSIKILESVPELSLSHFVAACRSGGKALVEQYRLPPSQAERLAGAGPEILMRIEELRLSSTTELSLNTAPSGESPTWQELNELSKGQKATAVLLLLLLDSDAPLIVDQPEDDLDNRFITEGIVPKMREEKQRRQFVFATHNANIPVLGDAELIVGLSAKGEADGGRATIEARHRGSIDTPSVRTFIEEILEGGTEAFERRRRKYGF